MKALIRQRLAAALWANDPANTDLDELVEALLPVVEGIVARAVAERGERTGIVVAVLAARAEIAEAALRRVDELCAVADEQPDGYECRSIAVDLIRKTLAGENQRSTRGQR